LNIDEDDDGNKASQPTTEKPWLNKDSEEFKRVQDYLKNNGKIDIVKSKYRLSKEVETLLTSKK